MPMTGESITCLNESNKNMEQQEVRKDLDSILKQAMPGEKYCAGGNKDFRTAPKRKQGGLEIIMKKHMNKHVRERSVDQRGRWAVTELEIGGVQIVIYNLYVPLQEDGGGATMVRRQLQNSLDEEGVEEELLTYLYRTLKEKVKADMKVGKQVLIGGDINKTHEEEGLMYEIFTELGLVNLFHEKMGKLPPTRKLGRRAIDHICLLPE